MPLRSDVLDLGRLALRAGEGRRLDLHVRLEPLRFGHDTYVVEPTDVPVRIDISRTTGGGYALRMQFSASLSGPCMRCLQDASPSFTVDAREVHQNGGGDELLSPYVEGEQLDLAKWARDAYALTLPATITCTRDCLGLCPQCGIDLNTAPAEHGHEAPKDPRFAKLSEIRFE